MPGELPKDTLLNILKALPMDITYIDEFDTIRYYSDYRIFKRTPEILGTAVQNCHRAEIRCEVNRVIEDLRSGRKDISEHQADKDGRRVRVCYIAISDKDGRYAGLLETATWVD
jgi:DUF438 domain-containing protein